MPVAVYPRLGELLRARGLSPGVLADQIEQRFGIAVDRRALERLAQPESLQRVDLALAGAAAAALGVDLGALFAVEASDIRSEEGAASADLDPEQSRRLAELFDRQARHGLSPGERAEAEVLVAEYGRRLRERLVGEPDAEGADAEPLETALAWFRSVESDVEWRRGLTKSRRRGPA